MFDRLFLWLVRRIDAVLGSSAMCVPFFIFNLQRNNMLLIASLNGKQSSVEAEAMYTLGVLDIFGYACFFFPMFCEISFHYIQF